MTEVSPQYTDLLYFHMSLHKYIKLQLKIANFPYSISLHFEMYLHQEKEQSTLASLLWKHRDFQSLPMPHEIESFAEPV